MPVEAGRERQEEEPIAGLQVFVVLENAKGELAVGGINDIGAPQLKPIATIDQISEVSAHPRVYDDWEGQIPRTKIVDDLAWGQMRLRLIDGDDITVSSILRDLGEAKVQIQKDGKEEFQSFPFRSLVEALSDIQTGTSLDSEGQPEDVHFALVRLESQEEAEEIKSALLVFGSTFQTDEGHYPAGIGLSSSYLREFSKSLLGFLRSNAKNLGIDQLEDDEPAFKGEGWAVRLRRGLRRTQKKIKKEKKPSLSSLLAEDFHGAGAEEISAHFQKLCEVLYGKEPAEVSAAPLREAERHPKEVRIKGVTFEVLHQPFSDGRSWLRGGERGLFAAVAYSDKAPFQAKGRDHVLEWSDKFVLRKVLPEGEKAELIRVTEGDRTIVLARSHKGELKVIEVKPYGKSRALVFPTNKPLENVYDVHLLGGEPLSRPLYVVLGLVHGYVQALVYPESFNPQTKPSKILHYYLYNPSWQPRKGGLHLLSSRHLVLSKKDGTAEYYGLSLRDRPSVKKLDVDRVLTDEGVADAEVTRPNHCLVATLSAKLICLDLEEGLERTYTVNFPQNEGRLQVAFNGPRTLVVQAPPRMESINQAHFYLLDSNDLHQRRGASGVMRDKLDAKLFLASVTPPAGRQDFFSQIRKKPPFSIVSVEPDKASGAFLVLISDGTVLRVK